MQPCATGRQKSTGQKNIDCCILPTTNSAIGIGSLKRRYYRKTILAAGDRRLGPSVRHVPQSAFFATIFTVSMNFSDLGLSDTVLNAVYDAGYQTPTPIQQQAIPILMSGGDLVGCAQTGTGKTASFTLPMIDLLAKGRARARMPRSLILEPTRELATQVAENFETYGKYNKLSKALLIGGRSFDDQSRIIDRGADVLIATPGRLLDHFGRGGLLLRGVEILVIDEADRMLDMGFIPDVEKIISLINPNRQTMLFSATMPAEIRRLANRYLSHAKEVSVAPPATTAATVEQSLVMVDQDDKRPALRALLKHEPIKNAFIFCNRKRDVDIVFKSLTKHGFGPGMLHGDMTQDRRLETLAQFKAGEINILVCSDVAARGLDIQGMSHVILFDVPIHADDYVHRIGRTGRAGMPGRAFTLSTKEDRKLVAAVEKLIGEQISLYPLDEDQLAQERRARRPRSQSGRPASSRPRRSRVREAIPDNAIAQDEMPAKDDGIAAKTANTPPEGATDDTAVETAPPKTARRSRTPVRSKTVEPAVTADIKPPTVSDFALVGLAVANLLPNGANDNTEVKPVEEEKPDTKKASPRRRSSAAADEAPKKRATRARRSPAKTAAAKPAAAPDKPVKSAKPDTKPKKAAAPRKSTKPTKKRDADIGKPVIGMGDHVPDFLRRT